MKFGEYPKMPSLGNVSGLRTHLASLGIAMPCDDIVAHGPDSPLGSALEFEGMTIGNRIGISPMEGWDGESDGRPSENTFRRWRRFGESGGKLIWGGEAVAVRADGRANPRAQQQPRRPHAVRHLALTRRTGSRPPRIDRQ